MLNELETARKAKLDALDAWRNSFWREGRIVPLDGRLVQVFDQDVADKHNSWCAMRTIVAAAATLAEIDSINIPA